MASLEACFHLIKLLLLISVGVDRKISSSYEHVDRFQSLLNKKAAEAFRGLRDEKSSGAMQVDEDGDVVSGGEVEVSYYIMDGSIQNYPCVVHKEKSDLLPETKLLEIRKPESKCSQMKLSSLKIDYW